MIQDILAVSLSMVGTGVSCAYLTLTCKADFDRVYRRAKPWTNSLVVLRATANRLPCNRYGIVVGRLVGGAVVRNRVKRRLREILRRLPLHQGWDIVCIARAASASADYHYLKQAVEELMGRARLLESE